MKSQIEELREIRKSLKIELEKIEFSQVEKINEIIYSLKNIKKLDMKPSIALEKWSALALNVINDALKIAPNYPWGGKTLEWSIESPPSLENFEEVPFVDKHPYDYSEPTSEK